MGKPKILFTSHTANFQKFNRPFMRMLSEQGYEVHYASMGEEEILDADKSFIVPFTRSPFKASNIQAYKQLKEIIDREGYDLIHTHTPMGSVVTRLAARDARKKGTRVIYTAHGFHFFKGAPLLNWLIYYPVEKAMAKYTDTLITINDEDYQRAKKKFKTDVRYVPGVGVDESKFKPRLTKKQRNELRITLGIKPDDFVMIYPAELSKRKRQLWLINALADFIKTHPDVHLLLPGGDSLGGKCQQLVAKLSLDKQIHFLGYRHDIPQLMMMSDLSVSSSSQEGLPVNLLEALAAGLPIVATDSRGHADLVKDNVNGYVTDKNDPKIFSKRVADMYRNTAKRIEMSSSSLEQLNGYGVVEAKDSMQEFYVQLDGVSSREQRLQTLAVLSSGFLPIPAAKGGAVEALCDNFLNENEHQKKLRITVYSNYDKDAIELSRKYRYTEFKYIKIARPIELLDLSIYSILRLIFPARNTSSFRYIFQRLFFMWKVSRDLSRKDYDKLLLENQVVQFWCLKLYGNYKRYQGKCYFHIHNEISSTFGCRKYVLSAHNIAVSRYIADNLRKKLNDTEGVGSYGVLRNCVEEATFGRKISKTRRSRLRSEYGINTDEKLILFTGRLAPEKGIDRLLIALRKVNFDNYRLLVVGSSFFGTNVHNPFAESLKDLALPLKDKITFTGYIDYSKMPDVYALSDFVVLPSTWNDPAPLTIIEALTCGLPIITTRSGGIPEYVNDKCAIVLNRDEFLVDNLAASIDELMGNQKILKRMSSESRRISKDLTIADYYRHMLDELNVKVAQK